MEERIWKSLLYDFYGELLTPHQKSVYGDYIQNDLSLSELAELSGISRQASYDMVKRCEKLLAGYEQRLHLVEHFREVKKLAAGIRDKAQELSRETGSDRMADQIREIVQLSDAILEEY